MFVLFVFFRGGAWDACPFIEAFLKLSSFFKVYRRNMVEISSDYCLILSDRSHPETHFFSNFEKGSETHPPTLISGVSYMFSFCIYFELGWTLDPPTHPPTPNWVKCVYPRPCKKRSAIHGFK